MKKLSEYGLMHQSNELRKLIMDNPDLPVVVLASDDANNGDWCWQYCYSVSCGIDEILDCDFVDNCDAVFNDRDYLEEYLYDILYDEYLNKSATEYNEAVTRKMEELEPYWTKVIAIYASN